MRILITRPAEDSAAFAARLAAHGHDTLIAPLLAPLYDDAGAPDFTGVQALAITSANGVRALARVSARRDVPVFAVGPQTAAEAIRAGFTDVRDGDGDAASLARRAAQWARPEKGALLHVCSHEAPGTLMNLLRDAGFGVRRASLYRVTAAPCLPPDARHALEAGALDGAMFFSPRSAAVFRDCLARDGGAALAGPLTAFCISAATAAALAPLAFAGTRIAARPNQDAMLALVV